MKIWMLLPLFVFSAGCMSKVGEAVRDVKYSAYEKLGYEKRDLFKSQVKEVKNDQGDSKQEVSDALEQLKKVYGFNGGSLERDYGKLKSRYDDAEKGAAEVRDSVAKLNTIAEDLFREWSKEIGTMNSADLKSKSQSQLDQTRRKYDAYFSQLKKSESAMDPVLSKMKDQVLFLKHNLNAAAIAGLKTEAGRIEQDISKLVDEMNRSISQADDLIKTL